MSERPPLAVVLGLEPHPEGGWYRRTWTSPVEVTTADGRVRPTATSIYFLLPAGESSAWHQVASDEVWVVHQGRVTLELGGGGDEPGQAEQRVLGLDLSAGELPQVVVPAGVWQRTSPSTSDALVTCLVSPGFDFADFQLASG